MTPTRKGEICRPNKAHDVSDRQPQVQRDREADQIGREPDLDQIRFVLGEVGLVAINSCLEPHRRIDGTAEDARLEDVERWEVDQCEHGQIQPSLSSQRFQPGHVLQLFAPGLLCELVHIKDFLEELDLVQVLEGTQVGGAEEAEEKAPLQIHFGDGRLRNDGLRQQVCRGRLGRGNQQVVGKRIRLGEFDVGEWRTWSG
mmetsp:Transcript_23923/g.66860  ORF Transcript_23923/g.66860 Transcript_23923/m.66860 type:complete len:200 (-) Transcript_23923:567-1166(-)